MKRKQLLWLGIAWMTAMMLAMVGFGFGRSAATDVPPALTIAQTPPPAAEAELTASTPLPISGTYSDPAEQFQIAIVEGFTVGSAGTAPLFESADGQVAYTVVVTPVNFQAGVTELGQDTLVEVARNAFRRGEGFQIGEVIESPDGGVGISWTGQVTVDRNSLPLTGNIIVRQSGANVISVLVSATEAGQAQLADLMATLVQSLEFS